jgi:hypothetical protein
MSVFSNLDIDRLVIAVLFGRQRFLARPLRESPHDDDFRVTPLVYRYTFE